MPARKDNDIPMIFRFVIKKNMYLPNVVKTTDLYCRYVYLQFYEIQNNSSI